MPHVGVYDSSIFFAGPGDPRVRDVALPSHSISVSQLEDRGTLNQSSLEKAAGEFFLGG